MMFAPWSTAQRMPAAMLAAEPEPLASSTLTGMIEHAAQVPATPMPLPARAAMTPATIVPWPSESDVSVPPSSAL